MSKNTKTVTATAATPVAPAPVVYIPLVQDDATGKWFVAGVRPTVCESEDAAEKLCVQAASDPERRRVAAVTL